MYTHSKILSGDIHFTGRRAWKKSPQWVDGKLNLFLSDVLWIGVKQACDWGLLNELYQMTVPNVRYAHIVHLRIDRAIHTWHLEKNVDTHPPLFYQGSSPKLRWRERAREARHFHAVLFFNLRMGVVTCEDIYIFKKPPAFVRISGKKGESVAQTRKNRRAKLQQESWLLTKVPKMIRYFKAAGSEVETIENTHTQQYQKQHQ